MPDEKFLYIVESRATPSGRIWRCEVADDGATLSTKTLAVDANGAGVIDGMRVDADGKLWYGWGSDGRAGADRPWRRRH